MGRFPVFIINLASAHDRWQRIAAHLEAFGLDRFQRLEAVDGRRFTNAEVSARVDRPFFENWYGRAPSAGEVGCTLSHLSAYSALLEGEAPFALVLEDDAELRREINSIVNNEVLSAWLVEDIPRVLLLTEVDRYLARPVKNIGNGYRVAVVRNAWLAHGYLINRAGAQLLLRLQSPIRFLVDDWMDLNMLWGVDVRCIVPHPIRLHETAQDSSLDRAREGLRNAARPRSIKRAVLRLGRRIADAVFYKAFCGIRKGEP